MSSGWTRQLSNMQNAGGTVNLDGLDLNGLDLDGLDLDGLDLNGLGFVEDENNLLRLSKKRFFLSNVYRPSLLERDFTYSIILIGKKL